MDVSCEPLMTWIWNASSLSFSISNKGFKLMKGGVLVVDFIMLIVIDEHTINKQQLRCMNKIMHRLEVTSNNFKPTP